MYHKIQLAKTTLLTAILIFGASLSSMAIDYTASVSGNWSSAATWGGTAPSFSITGADNIIIPAGLTVTQDASVSINNAAAVLSVVGTLTSTTSNLLITAGTLSGTGTVILNSLIVGATGAVTSLGPISVNQFANSAATLALTDVLSVTDTVTMAAGVVSLGAGGAINFASGIVLNMAGGTYSAVGGLPTLAGSFNLLYTGAVATIGAEAALSGLNNVTINLISPTNVLALASSLTVTGVLTLQQGILSLGANTLTIAGSINPSGSGTVSGAALSNITFSGSGNAGILTLTAGSQTINNLTINIGSAGTVALGSAAIISGALTLAQGTVNIGSHDLTLAATGVLTGGSSASYVVTSDAGSLIMNVALAGATGVFQVGTIANYAPVTVTNNSTAAGTFNVLAHDGVMLNGTSGADISQFQPVVNTSWDVESSLTTGANVNLLMGWNTSMQVNAFDNTQAFISHYTAGAWNTSTISASTVLGGGLFSLALTGVTSFSPFAVFGHNVALGVVAVNNNDAMEIYPNPSTDKLTIQIASASTVTNVEITDISGQTVARFELTNGNNTIGIANLNTGSYFVKVSNSEMSAVKKFVKI